MGGQGPAGPQGQNGPAHTYPYAGTSAHAGQAQHQETVNGGAYAYVIRDDDDGTRSARRQPVVDQMPASQPHSRHVRGSRTEPLSLGPAPSAAGADVRGAPVHDGPRAGSQADEAPVSDAVVPFSADDPAYGPPSQEWYQHAEEARRQETEDELRLSRGPFEPLPPDHEITIQAPPATTGAGPGDPRDDPPDGRRSDSQASSPGQASNPGQADTTGQADQAKSGETHDPAQSGDVREDDLDVALVGQGTGPLARIKDLYVTVEAVGDRTIDKHFDELLERQRQLISDYFTKQEFRGSPRPDASPPAAAPGAAGRSGGSRSGDGARPGSRSGDGARPGSRSGDGAPPGSRSGDGARPGSRAGDGPRPGSGAADEAKAGSDSQRPRVGRAPRSPR